MISEVFTKKPPIRVYCLIYFITISFEAYVLDLDYGNNTIIALVTENFLGFTVFGFHTLILGYTTDR